ncbi:motility protein A, partial [bacterium]|nr:motility protein A [bacterium]
MDLGSVIGLAGTFFLLFVSISLSGSILQFVDIPSIMIVAGCSFATFLVSNPKRICLATIKYLMIACRSYKVNLLEIISIFVSFAEKARRDGLLALESDIDELKDDFLRRGLQMVVDGTDPNLIKSILEIDLAAMEDRHATAAQ